MNIVASGAATGAGFAAAGGTFACGMNIVASGAAAAGAFATEGPGFAADGSLRRFAARRRIRWSRRADRNGRRLRGHRRVFRRRGRRRRDRTEKHRRVWRSRFRGGRRGLRGRGQRLRRGRIGERLRRGRRRLRERRFRGSAQRSGRGGRRKHEPRAVLGAHQDLVFPLGLALRTDVQRRLVGERNSRHFFDPFDCGQTSKLSRKRRAIASVSLARAPSEKLRFACARKQDH